jgi:hypothetical protein
MNVKCYNRTCIFALNIWHTNRMYVTSYIKTANCNTRTCIFIVHVNGEMLPGTYVIFVLF